MADAVKQIVSPAAALKKVGADLEKVVEQEAPPAAVQGPASAPSVAPAKRWKFVKLHCPGQLIQFKDGSEFTFRLVNRNTGGYAPTSDLVTSDEKLAEKLRSLPEHFGVVEVKI